MGALALLLVFAGCQTYESQTQQFTQSTKSGSLVTAVTEIDKQVVANTGHKDELIFRLVVPRARPPWRIRPKCPTSGRRWSPRKKGEPAPEPLPEPTLAEVHAHYYTRSVEAFDQAEEKVNTWEEQAKVKVGSEAAALVSNQASLPYRGRADHKVMMNTYKALDYLALGEKDKARVELNRSLQRQRDAVEANQKRIAAAQGDAEKARNGELKDEKGQSAAYDADKAMDDAKTGPALQAALNGSIAPMKPYGDYVNPFSVFHGLFFTVLGEGGSDFERGRKSFRNASPAWCRRIPTCRPILMRPPARLKAKLPRV